MLNIRPAVPADAPTIANLVRELADYEKLLDEARATPQDFLRELESPNPVIRVLIAEWNGEPCGFALYFFTFSTFKARPTLYLEDLFVVPEERGSGIGRRLLVELARIAVARDCGRMEWSVLDWNTPAREFYFKLGAVAMDEWTVFRMTPDAFGRLAREDLPAEPPSEVV